MFVNTNQNNQLQIFHDVSSKKMDRLDHMTSNESEWRIYLRLPVGEHLQHVSNLIIVASKLTVNFKWVVPKKKLVSQHGKVHGEMTQL